MYVSEMVELLKDKYVFLDLDGTLSPYRFNDHVNGRSGLGGQSLKELLFDKTIFLKQRPLQTMITILKQINPEKLYILGANCTNNEIEQKLKWLKIYYPFIKEDHIIFVCASDLKVQVMEAYCEKIGVSRHDMVLVEDKHKTLYDAEEAGFIAYHVTSFMP